MTDLATVAATVASDIKEFRKGAVTAENRGDVSARSLLASLLIPNGMTKALAESAIIVAFGNPKSPKSGKPVAKLSGLRDFTGGDAVRKMAETVFRIVENVDADAPRVVPATVEGETETTVGAGAIRPLIVSFILQTEGAPKSLRALSEGVATALRAHAKAISPDNSEAASETASETADAAPAPSFDAKAAIDTLAVFFGQMTVEEAEAIGPHVSALMAAYDNRINALTDSGEADVAVNG